MKTQCSKNTNLHSTTNNCSQRENGIRILEDLCEQVELQGAMTHQECFIAQESTRIIIKFLINDHEVEIKYKTKIVHRKQQQSSKLYPSY